MSLRVAVHLTHWYSWTLLACTCKSNQLVLEFSAHGMEREETVLYAYVKNILLLLRASHVGCPSREIRLKLLSALLAAHQGIFTFQALLMGKPNLIRDCRPSYMKIGTRVG